MDLAKDISGRADAKKVVLFFTDGSPTSYSSFEPSVANGAINKANGHEGKTAPSFTPLAFLAARIPAADPTAYQYD